MIRLSNIITEVVNNNPLLKLGMHQRLFNLAQLARFIHPLVETRAKKGVSHSAIVMSLSRLQRSFSKDAIERSQFKIENLTITKSLMTCTYPKTHAVQNSIQTLHTEIRKLDGYLTLTAGTNQITIIIDEQNEKVIHKLVTTKPLNIQKNIASIGISFDEKYLQFPGMLYILLQQITLQNINIIEIASTSTEIVIYVEDKDAKIAFDTLFHLFI